MRELAAFLAIAVVVIVTPGQDTALTIRNTLLGGRAAGVSTAVGIVSGIACWTLAASGAGLRRAEARRRRLPRLPGAPGAAPCDPSGWSGGRPRRRLATGTSPRVPAGTAEQPRQPEDRRLLHKPPAAVRRLLLEPARARASVLLARARLAVRVLVRRRPRRRRPATPADPAVTRRSQRDGPRGLRDQARRGQMSFSGVGGLTADSRSRR